MTTEVSVAPGNVVLAAFVHEGLGPSMHASRNLVTMKPSEGVHQVVLPPPCVSR